jgi:hypothetical protein
MIQTLEPHDWIKGCLFQFFITFVDYLLRYPKIR